MKKLKYIAVPLLLAVLLVGFFGEYSQVVAEELPPTSSKLAPETPEEASKLMNVPAERLSRDPVGGNGWYMALDESNPLPITLQRYSFAVTPIDDDPYDPTDDPSGIMVTPPVVVATRWFRDDLIPYPETNYSIEYFPYIPVENETVYFSIVTDGAVAKVITEIEWHFGSTIQTYSTEEGMEVTTKFPSAGSYEVYVYLKDKWDEVVYEIYPIQVAVDQKPNLYQIFMPLIVVPTNWIPFTDPIEGYCPADLTVLVAIAEWLHIDPCSFSLVNWEDNIPITLQEGMRADVWNFETEQIDQIFGPIQFMSKGRPLSVHVLKWWP